MIWLQTLICRTWGSLWGSTRRLSKLVSTLYPVGLGLRGTLFLGGCLWLFSMSTCGELTSVPQRRHLAGLFVLLARCSSFQQSSAVQLRQVIIVKNRKAKRWTLSCVGVSQVYGRPRGTWRRPSSEGETGTLGRGDHWPLALCVGLEVEAEGRLAWSFF